MLATGRPAALQQAGRQWASAALSRLRLKQRDHVRLACLLGTVLALAWCINASPSGAPTYRAARGRRSELADQLEADDGAARAAARGARRWAGTAGGPRSAWAAPPRSDDGAAAAACAGPPAFEGYFPSSWEWQWIRWDALLQSDPTSVCGAMAGESELAAAWVAATAAWQRGEAGPGRLAAAGQQVLSFAVLRDRHPNAIPACAIGPVVHVQSRDYLLPGGLGPRELAHLYPGRRLLFDIGAARYGSSLAWYSKLGMDFDEIYAFESNATLLYGEGQANYWDDVPGWLLSRLHLYTASVDNATTSPANPLNMIREGPPRRLAREGDYVVVKLDIDDSPLELSLIRQVEEDPVLARSLISELYFEAHYDHRDMWDNFGRVPDMSHVDVLRLFSKLRARGLRLHYWP
eukprot:scaffold9.g3206.t1